MAGSRGARPARGRAVNKSLILLTRSRAGGAWPGGRRALLLEAAQADLQAGLAAMYVNGGLWARGGALFARIRLRKRPIFAVFVTNVTAWVNKTAVLLT